LAEAWINGGHNTTYQGRDAPDLQKALQALSYMEYIKCTDSQLFLKNITHAKRETMLGFF
jgi:hypothetical protein